MKINDFSVPRRMSKKRFCNSVHEGPAELYESFLDIGRFQIFRFSA